MSVRMARSTELWSTVLGSPPPHAASVPASSTATARRTSVALGGGRAPARARPGARGRGGRTRRRAGSVRAARAGRGSVAGALPTALAAALGSLGAVPAAVVGVVEAGALEVNRRGVQHLLHGCAAVDARGERIVAHPLHHVEQMPVLAAVLVDRHLFSIPTLALGIGQC